ncbi:uncharacterized protein LOC130807426 [Amaranthus tricolor]|uniref:uncharacterized protein LOC130807426 n=1 Tax=Amaranthus tricolor TaxID=29722 RepID=UPI00258F1951|nr:uncharacterized protein LOC130807426 [Amaranthus tricolor]
MEDCNTLVSDCIIISCCCQCLILQFVLFVFVQLPRKLAKKTKQYAKRKLNRNRKNKTELNVDQIKPRRVDHDEDFVLMNEIHDWGSCNQEIERVLMELSLNGEFAFGSFWGRNSQLQNIKYYSENCKCKCNCSGSLTIQNHLQQFGSHVVDFYFIKVIKPF